MPFNLTAILLGLLVPFAISATVGLWLTLWGSTGLSMRSRRQNSMGISKIVIRTTVVVLAWVGAVAILIDYLLLIFRGHSTILSLCLLPSHNSRTAAVLDKWWSAAPVFWHALAIEGPFVLLVQLGLPAILSVTSMKEKRVKRIIRYAEAALLFMGLLTLLLGYGWSVWIASSSPNILWKYTKLGFSSSPILLSLCPLNLALAIGLSIKLAVAGKKPIGMSIGASIALAIAAAMIIALTIGTILSIMFVQSS
jgi:hypothetical protein